METKICVVGLGYVGLPLAVEFSKFFPTIGFDVNEKRISELKNNHDSSNEISKENLINCQVDFTNFAERLKEANFIVVCVPTPIDKAKNPDLSFLRSASQMVGNNLSNGSVVIYESTVYPGCTEEECIPILEKFSNLKCGSDFTVGYSPERVNPGDKERTVNKITKIVAGISEESLDLIDSVYSKITQTYRAKSIKVAEAAKVIENIQRDLNIALVNELALIFNRMDINTKDVLEAAGTKWNFHHYKPGLVGGHCIGVDPYYLTYKAEELGHHPEIILAGRRINDNMHKFYAEKIIKGLNQSGKPLQGSKVAVMGLTFKENVKDWRNSRVKYLINELKGYGIEVLGCDPLLESEVVREQFGVENHDFNNLQNVDGLILVNFHKEFEEIGLENISKKADVFVNIKNC